MVENSSGWIEVPSFAKINLMLDVVGKRDDGYHEIVSLFQEITLHDTLYFRKIREKTVKITGANLPAGNTIEKAYEAFSKYVSIDFGIEVRIIKRIPSGSGLGGASSNAGTVIRYLSDELNVYEKRVLEKIASEVGSDVTFFLYGGTALVKGRGEVVEPLEDLPEYGIKISMPSFRMSTKKAYSYLNEYDFGKAPCTPLDLYSAYAEADYYRIKECSYNIFQESFINVFYEIKLAKKVLDKEKPIVSLMTGSGSAIFGVFEKEKGVFRFLKRTERESFIKKRRKSL